VQRHRANARAACSMHAQYIQTDGTDYPYTPERCVTLQIRFIIGACFFSIRADQNCYCIVLLTADETPTPSDKQKTEIQNASCHKQIARLRVQHAARTPTNSLIFHMFYADLTPAFKGDPTDCRKLQ